MTPPTAGTAPAKTKSATESATDATFVASPVEIARAKIRAHILTKKPDANPAEIADWTEMELRGDEHQLLRDIWKWVPHTFESAFGFDNDGRRAMADAIADRSMYVRSLPNDKLFPLGERALTDIIDNIVALHEIRRRFNAAKKGESLMGYASWSAFVKKNSRFSIRTVQRKLSEIDGKDTSKVNIGPAASNRELRRRAFKAEHPEFASASNKEVDRAIYTSGKFIPPDGYPPTASLREPLDYANAPKKLEPSPSVLVTKAEQWRDELLQLARRIQSLTTAIRGVVGTDSTVPEYAALLPLSKDLITALETLAPMPTPQKPEPATKQIVALTKGTLVNVGKKVYKITDLGDDGVERYVILTEKDTVKSQNRSTLVTFTEMAEALRN